MGRYYNGDIDGKFMFGVQNSDAADRFGVTGSQPSELYYYFDNENLEDVQKELERIEETCEPYLSAITNYFEAQPYYNDKDMAGHLGVTEEILKKYLSEFADYRLGKQIEEKIIEIGSCEFTAEL
jgi:hypothetical protein